MHKRTLLATTIMFGGFFLTGDTAHAQKKDVLVTQKFSGSVANEKLRKDAPDVITDAADLAKVWKAWKIEGNPPKIDFDKMMVVAAYGGGSRLNLASVKLDEKGNLEVLAMATLDLAEGFRFILAVVSNDGVKTVNGKKIPEKAKK